jgi:hypothetical protein
MAAGRGRRAVGRREVSLEGLIVPADWDENDAITLVSLLTDDEGEYLVAADSVGRKLTTCIHKRVRVAGSLTKDGLGEYVVTVERFSVVDAATSS